MDEAKIEELARSIRANGIIQPIVVRKVDERLRDRRRRTALARVAARRPAQGAGRRPRHPGGAAARGGAHREHPARGPESDRRSARVSAPRRRVPADPGTDRRRGRQGSIVDRQLPAPAQASAGGARRTSGRARSRWGMRARCSVSPTKPHSCASAATSSRRNLSVRETEALVKKESQAPAEKPRRRKGRAHARRRGAAALRPRHPRPDRPQTQREARSKSISLRKKSCNRLYEMLTEQ